jgi:hypothetical protein
MLHLIYILTFTILAFLAVGNLIRNLMTLSADSQRFYGSSPQPSPSSPSQLSLNNRKDTSTYHPELLDDSGNIVREPYLVMRSITVEDAREQLDALYNSSPGASDDRHDES